MVPEQLRMTLYLNPIFYMTQTFRATLLATEHASATVWAVYAIMSVGLFVVGSAFFLTFKDVLVDYE